MNCKEAPLVSVVVLSYKNYNVIFDTLNSILNQDYPNLELIVSNDASDDFDRDGLFALLEKNRASYPNVKNIEVYQNEKNVGTTKNVNGALRHISGKYFKLIAADDLFYSEDCISQFVEYMEAHPDAYFVVAQSLAYDNGLKNFLRYYPSTEQMRLLATSTADEQFRILAQDCIINAPSVFFSSRYLEDFGYFDERYFYADDWPAWISFTRSGHRIQVLEKPLVVYRFGGVSNTNVYNPSEVGTKVTDEYFRIMYNEGTSYVRKLGFKKAMFCRWLCMSHELSSRDRGVRRRAVFKYLDLYLLSKANQLRKAEYWKFMLLLVAVFFLWTGAGFAAAAARAPLLGTVLLVFLTAGKVLFWLMLLFYAACFLFDLLR